MAAKKTKSKPAKTPSKKAPAAKAAAGAPPAESFLVGSKVKAAIKAAGCNTGGDALEALNSYVAWLINSATKRAGANGRKTVRGHDFLIM